MIPKILDCTCLKLSGYQHLCVCVHVCVGRCICTCMGGYACCVCACLCGEVHMYMYGWICMLALCVLISYSSSYLFVETGLSPHRELTGSARLVGQPAQGPSPALRLKPLSTVPSFVHGCWDLNSDSHARTCPASS